MTVQELYDRYIKGLSERERLNLARLILHEIAPDRPVDFDTEWASEDLSDLALHTWRQARYE